MNNKTNFFVIHSIHANAYLNEMKDKISTLDVIEIIGNEHFNFIFVVQTNPL